MIQTLQALLYIRQLDQPTEEDLQERRVDLPPPRKNHRQRVVIFDLDETLVHCVENTQA